MKMKLMEDEENYDKLETIKRQINKMKN